MAQKQLKNDDSRAEVEIPYFEGVCFDPDTYTIHGNYNDEVSAHRAKKCWLEAFNQHFNIEKDSDLHIFVEPSNCGSFLLNCRFASASAKYAFWKCTNNQAPEVQYVLETAHIPICDSRYDELLTAPDLRSIFELPMVTNPPASHRPGSKLQKILDKVLERN